MGLLLLTLATAGATAFLRARTELPMAFCPAAGIALQILTLYALALLGLLRYGSCLLVLAGALGLCWTVFRRRAVLREFLSPGIAAFCLYVLVVWALNAGTTPDGFDNYSHWALAAKELYLTHALPGTDTLVTMTNYPPAVPLYEYWVLRLAGFSEGAMLGANGLLMGALLTCGFGDCGWKDWKRWLVCAGLMAALTLVVPNCAVNLQVDALLGAMALSMGLLALWDARKSMPIQGLLAVVLVLTKMSGAMLLVLHLALLMAIWYRKKGSRRDFLRGAVWCAGLPALAYGAFCFRIHRVFADALARNQFQVGADAFGGKLAEKSSEFWISFPADFWHAIWNGESAASLFFLVGNGVLAVVLVLGILKILRLPKGAAGLIFVSWAGLAFYTLGLAGMYIFMMDEYESIILASFYRYFGTGVLYQLGLCSLGLLLLPPGEGDHAARILPSLACLLALVVPCLWTQAPVSDWEAVSLGSREALRREVLENRAQVTQVWDGETMLYCVTDQTHLNEDYIYRFVRYAFFSSRVRPMGPGLTRPEDLEEGGSCYLLWLTNDTWAVQTLADAGLKAPDAPGLYYKTGENELLPVHSAAGK